MHGESAWEPGGGEAQGRYAGRRWHHGRGPRGKASAAGFGPPWMDLGLGGLGHWFGEGRTMRGPRAKRGDVRAAALALLAESPKNGYQIIQEISERSGGVWRPSPGSVYPALQQLEDEGLIEPQADQGGRRKYALTAEGREYVEGHPDEMEAPWDVMARSVGADAVELRALFGQVVMAAIQVARVGSDEQIAQAHQVLGDARRRLYRILAADEQDAP